jgi:hypothetical protein
MQKVFKEGQVQDPIPALPGIEFKIPVSAKTTKKREQIRRTEFFTEKSKSSPGCNNGLNFVNYY